MEYVIRFVAGGAVISLFAILADVIRPKSLAGLLSASPAVALVTLGLAFVSKDATYTSIEGRSMVFGSIALCLYSALVCQLLVRANVSALTATIMSLPVWLFVSVFLLVSIVGWS